MTMKFMDENQQVSLIWDLMPTVSNKRQTQIVTQPIAWNVKFLLWPHLGPVPKMIFVFWHNLLLAMPATLSSCILLMKIHQTMPKLVLFLVWHLKWVITLHFEFGQYNPFMWNDRWNRQVNFITLN